jgi:hypothetical protein
MKIIYANTNRTNENLFYFHKKWFGEVYIIINTDTEYLEEVEYKCVRKLIKVSFMNTKKSYLTVCYKEI